MTLTTDSTRWYTADSGSNHEWEQTAYGVLVYDQQFVGKRIDGHKLDKPSEAGFEPFAYVTQSGEIETLKPRLNIEPKIGESGERLDRKSLEARSPFGSGYNIAFEDSSTSAIKAVGADLVGELQLSNFEDDWRARQTFHLQDAGRKSDGVPMYDLNLGEISNDFLLTSLQGYSTDSEPCMVAPPTREPSLWHSVTSIPEPSPKKPTRKSKGTRYRPHTQLKGHLCDRYLGAFSRAGDLRRHYGTHFPDHYPFHCRIEGCSRNGKNGFYRRDKLRDHQRQAHGLGCENGFVFLKEDIGCTKVFNPPQYNRQ